MLLFQRIANWWTGGEDCLLSNLLVVVLVGMTTLPAYYILEQMRDDQIQFNLVGSVALAGVSIGAALMLIVRVLFRER